jgi:hypothetical protein
LPTLRRRKKKEKSENPKVRTKMSEKKECWLVWFVGLIWSVCRMSVIYLKLEEKKGSTCLLLLIGCFCGQVVGALACPFALALDVFFSFFLSSLSLS